MSRNLGFTLIELMITVAIAGVLAAISVSVYQGSLAKSQVNRAVSELSMYRAAVEGRLSGLQDFTNSEIGYVPSNLTTGDLATNVGTFSTDGSGGLQVTMGGKAHPNLSGVVLRFAQLKGSDRF